MKKTTLLLLVFLSVTLGARASKDVWRGVIDGTTAKRDSTISASNFKDLIEGDFFVVTLANYVAGATLSLKEAGGNWNFLVINGNANTASYTTPAVTGDLYTNIKTYGLVVEIEKAKVTKITIVRAKSVSSLEPTVASDVLDASTGDGGVSKDYSDLSTRFSSLSVGDIVRFHLTPNSESYHQISIYGLTGDGWSQTINVIPQSSATNGNFDVIVSDETVLSYFKGTAADQRAIRIWIKYNTLTSIQIIKTLSITESANPDCETGTYENVKLTRSLIAGYNTLCLPFGATKAALGLQDGDAIYELVEGSTASYIKLSEVTSIVANKPYLVFCAAARTLTSSFDNLTVSSSDDVSPTTQGVWKMYGNYTPNLSMNGKYIVYGNEVRLCGDGPYLNGLRAYFEYTGTGAGARETVSLDFGGGATGIQQVKNAKLDVVVYYDLQGRKVAQPTKGFYIVNGKKVMIK